MPAGVKTTPEAIAAWSEALEEGMGYQHVAEAFGVSKVTVMKYLPGRGWTHKQVTEHGTFMKHHNEKVRKQERKNKVALPHDPYHDALTEMSQRRAAGASKHEQYNG